MRLSLWPRRLGSQLLLLVVGALLLSLALLSAYTIRQQQAQVLTGLDAQARSIAQTLALACENPLLTNQLDQVEALLLAKAGSGEVVELQVLDLRGQDLGHVRRPPGQLAQVVFEGLMAAQDLPGEAQPSLVHSATPLGDQAVAWHPIGSVMPIGWVRVGYSLEALDRIDRGIWTGTLVAALLASVLVSVLVAVVLRAPLQALDRARDFASQLVAADGRQLPVPASPAEVNALTRALNLASRRLHAQHTLIQRTLGQLTDHETQLSGTNEQLQTIFAFSPNGIASFDAEGRICQANDALHRLVGLPPGTLVGQTVDALESQIHAIAAEPDPPRLKRLFAPLNAEDAAARTETVAPRLVLAVHLPGITRLELTGQHAPGAAAPHLLHVRDLTHDSEIERLKDEFLSTAAHELRTPIVSIHGFVELLLMRDFPPERRQKMLATVHRQSAVLIEIVNDLLDISRIEAAGVEHEALRPTDPLPAVQAVLQGFRPSPVTRPGPELIVEGPLAAVRIEPGKFAQVLRNLLSNAYKYSPQGGPVRVRLGLGADASGATVLRIAVEDEGIGMTPAQLERVFQRFYRADASGNIPGTGLGMSIVKQLVELLGGEVQVASRFGAGTTVTVLLPALEAGVKPEALSAPAALAGHEAPSTLA